MVRIESSGFKQQYAREAKCSNITGKWRVI